jgi:exosome complex RNA-binding protein Csl4
MDKEERKIVIPGEVIVKGNEYLPGDGAYRDGEDVVARRFGIASIAKNMLESLRFLVLIIPEEVIPS